MTSVRRSLAYVVVENQLIFALQFAMYVITEKEIADAALIFSVVSSDSLIM